MAEELRKFLGLAIYDAERTYLSTATVFARDVGDAMRILQEKWPQYEVVEAYDAEYLKYLLESVTNDEPADVTADSPVEE